MVMLGLPVILLLVVVWCFGFVRLWQGALRRPSDGLSQCGHCGYAVEGLETMQCPECGSDFRKVGIVTSARREPGTSISTFGFVWAALTFPFVFITALLLKIVGIAPLTAVVAISVYVAAWFIPYAIGMAIFLNFRRR